MDGWMDGWMDRSSKKANRLYNTIYNKTQFALQLQNTIKRKIYALQFDKTITMLCTNSKCTNIYESLNKKTFNIFHKLTGSICHVFNECILCKIQYVGKSETAFNLRLNNHRKDVNNLKAIPAYHHFKIHGHNY